MLVAYFFRVYSGVVNSGDTVYNPVKGRKERIGRIVQMHANNREEIKEVFAGDIAAVLDLRMQLLVIPMRTNKPIILEQMIFLNQLFLKQLSLKQKQTKKKWH